MLLHISSDGAPIYQQIVDQIRFRIISGQMHAGDELPTIRGLAESLRVNPNTVARAYRELENDELVEKRRTTGTFVCELPKKIGAAQRRKLIAPAMDKLLIESRQLGIALDDLIEQLHKRDDQLQRSETRS
ncbi:MAG: GntR family transcriptional regulator [Pirellulaceae bacterium]|nr:GntR family transcriptional regulator [Pirellulaceae bacterium]